MGLVTASAQLTSLFSLFLENYTNTAATETLTVLLSRAFIICWSVAVVSRCRRKPLLLLIFSARVSKRWKPLPGMIEVLPQSACFRARVALLDGVSFHLPPCQAEIMCDGNSASGRNWSGNACFCRFHPSSRAGRDRSNTPPLLSTEESSTPIAMNKEGISRYLFYAAV